MISKEKKQAIMAEYARTPGDTGSPEVQVAVLTARNSGAYRALESKPQRSSFKTWSSENGRSETWTVSLPEENRHRKIPCTD